MAPIMKDFHLTIMDQTMLRMYVRQLLIFPFPDPVHTRDATRALRTGLHTALVQLPFLAGTISSLTEQNGQLNLRYPDRIGDDLIDQIFTANRDLAKARAYDFKTMKEAGFPPSHLPPDVLCPALLKNHPGVDDAFAQGLVSFKAGHPVPVFAAQAAFIPGGLILSVYSNHSVVDGNGIAQIYRIWSNFTRAQSETDVPRSVMTSPNPSSTASRPDGGLESLRRRFDTFSQSAEMSRCPEVRFPGTPPRTRKLRSGPYELEAKILSFSAPAISELVATLSSLTGTRVSSFTGLVALVWTQVTIARSAALLAANIHETRLCIAYDHRKNLGKDFTESYLGNCATGTLVSTPVSTMLPQSSKTVDAGHLVPIALSIIDTLSSVDLGWLKTRLSLFSRTPNSYQLAMDVDIPNGPDLFVTSWMHMGADCAWHIPGTTRRTPSAIRKPQSKTEGNIHILPRSKEGGNVGPFEVLLCLEKGEMERTMCGLEEGGWVERFIDA